MSGSIAQRVYVGIQRLILRMSYRAHAIRRPSRELWVVGVIEVAGMTKRIADCLPTGRTVLMSPHPFYSERGDYSPPQMSFKPLNTVVRLVWGPWMLGRLLHSSKGFVYLGALGFLFDGLDARRFEFEFIKKHDGRIVCIFTGNDIRSDRCSLEVAARTGRPNLSAITAELNPKLASESYDAVKKAIAATADDFCDVIYNFDVDQASYLTRKTEPFFYAYPDERMHYFPEKFVNPTRPVVVHAPSKTVIKGTAFAREAVARLQAEGYDFEYVELINVSNAEVLETLHRSHIALNQFWALAPGAFGIEAMANTCAMLCSADGEIETQLPAGANDAWMVTLTTDVYANLKKCLDDWEFTTAQALRGFEWVTLYETQSVNARAFRAKLATL
jgi:hypothetical protein